VPDFDLGLEGGIVVAAGGRRRASVYIVDGTVGAVTGERLSARERFDASGLLVMPGMVDAHVHFMDPGDASREDFPAGSGAAVRAGVTTVIEHTHAAPVRTPAELQRKASYLSERSHADYGLAAHAWPGEAGAAAEVWRAGAAFVKAFTCTTHGVAGHSPSELQALFQALEPVRGTCLLHCEDESMTAAAEWRLRAQGRSDGLLLPEWRSPEAEEAAVAVAAVLARQAPGVRAVLAHASHPAVLDLARPTMTIESCPQYLTLRETEVAELGGLRKFTPPARARTEEDIEAMWTAVSGGGVDYIASDHAPATREQKVSGSIWDCHFGIPGVDTTFSVLLDAAARGLLTYEQVVSLYSTRPAEIYGLRRKGRLEPGMDGDVVVVDPAAVWHVQDSDVLSKAGWTPFAGRTLRGRAVRTYLRGSLAAAAGKVLSEPGAGSFVPGPGAAFEGLRPAGVQRALAG
jgi:dihydroorotase (multifunctional complex type)